MIGEWKNKQKIEEAVSQQSSPQKLTASSPVLDDGIWLLNGKPWDRVEDFKLFIREELKRQLEVKVGQNSPP